MDYSEIEINNKVYLFDGIYSISEFWEDYRVAGYYDMYHWENIDGKWYGAKYTQHLESHLIIKFKVNESENVYIWEDWNYQQSFLHLNYEQHK